MARLITPVLLVMLLLVTLLSLSVGSTAVDVWAGLLDFFNERQSLGAIVVVDIRLPRTLIALAVGAALG